MLSKYSYILTVRKSFRDKYGENKGFSSYESLMDYIKENNLPITITEDEVFKSFDDDGGFITVKNNLTYLGFKGTTIPKLKLENYYLYEYNENNIVLISMRQKIIPYFYLSVKTPFGRELKPLSVYIEENGTSRVSIDGKKITTKKIMELAGVPKECIRDKVKRAGRKIYCEETGKTYNSVEEAAEDTGVSTSTISYYAIGIGKKNKKGFKYIDD